jgi:hypothetical protein
MPEAPSWEAAARLTLAAPRQARRRCCPMVRAVLRGGEGSTRRGVCVGGPTKEAVLARPFNFLESLYIPFLMALFDHINQIHATE